MNVNVINHVILENTCRNKNKCRNKTVDKLVEKCSENIDGNEMIYNKTVNAKVRNSCTIYIVLFVIFLIISISIVFIYFPWCLKKDNIRVKFNTNTQTATY